MSLAALLREGPNTGGDVLLNRVQDANLPPAEFSAFIEVINDTRFSSPVVARALLMQGIPTNDAQVRRLRQKIADGLIDVTSHRTKAGFSITAKDETTYSTNPVFNIPGNAGNPNSGNGEK